MTLLAPPLTSIPFLGAELPQLYLLPGDVFRELRDVVLGRRLVLSLDLVLVGQVRFVLGLSDLHDWLLHGAGLGRDSVDGVKGALAASRSLNTLVRIAVSDHDKLERLLGSLVISLVIRLLSPLTLRHLQELLGRRALGQATHAKASGLTEVAVRRLAGRVVIGSLWRPSRRLGSDGQRISITRRGYHDLLE